MLDPNLSSQQLYALAMQRPDLWSQMHDHPNCYPELRAWLVQAEAAMQAQQAQQVAAQAQAQSAPLAQYAPETQAATYPPANVQVPVQPHGAAQPQHTPQRRKINRKRLAIVVIVCVVALVAVGGVTAALLWGGGKDENIAQALTKNAKFSNRTLNKDLNGSRVLSLGAANNVLVPMLNADRNVITVVADGKVLPQKAHPAPLWFRDLFVRTEDGLSVAGAGQFDEGGTLKPFANAHAVPVGVTKEGQPIMYALAKENIKKLDGLDFGGWDASDTKAKPAKKKEGFAAAAPYLMEGTLTVGSGKPQAFQGILGGSNAKRVCAQAAAAISCVEAQMGKTSTVKVELPKAEGPLVAKVFPLEDGYMITRQIGNEARTYLVDVKGKIEELKGALENFRPDVPFFETRKTDGMTRAMVKAALTAKAVRLLPVSGKVFAQAKMGESQWAVIDSSGKMSKPLAVSRPLYVDGGLLVAAIGMAPSSSQLAEPPTDKQIGVYQVNGGKRISAFALPDGSAASVSGGRVYAVATEGAGDQEAHDASAQGGAQGDEAAKGGGSEDGGAASGAPSHLLEYGTDEGTEVTYTKANAISAAPATEQGDKEAIKEFDFGNALWARPDLSKDVNLGGQFTNGKGSDEMGTLTYLPEKTAYADINGDGYMDAATLLEVETGGQYRYRLNIWVWDPQKDTALISPITVAGRTAAPSPERDPDTFAVEATDNSFIVKRWVGMMQSEIVAFRDGAYFKGNGAIATAAGRPEGAETEDLSGRTIRSAAYDDAPAPTFDFDNKGSESSLVSINGFNAYRVTDLSDGQDYLVWVK